MQRAASLPRVLVGENSTRGESARADSEPAKETIPTSGSYETARPSTRQRSGHRVGRGSFATRTRGASASTTPTMEEPAQDDSKTQAPPRLAQVAATAATRARTRGASEHRASSPRASRNKRPPAAPLAAALARAALSARVPKGSHKSADAIGTSSPRNAPDQAYPSARATASSWPASATGWANEAAATSGARTQQKSIAASRRVDGRCRSSSTARPCLDARVVGN
jgi:hypothetical protein